MSKPSNRNGLSAAVMADFRRRDNTALTRQEIARLYWRKAVCTWLVGDGELAFEYYTVFKLLGGVVNDVAAPVERERTDGRKA